MTIDISQVLIQGWERLIAQYKKGLIILNYYPTTLIHMSVDLNDPQEYIPDMVDRVYCYGVIN